MSNAAITVSKNGSVFVPCYPGGTIYDLVEVISQHLTNIGKQGVPLYFLSPGAKPSLLYANIFAEWYVMLYIYMHMPVYTCIHGGIVMYYFLESNSLLFHPYSLLDLYMT